MATLTDHRPASMGRRIMWFILIATAWCFAIASPVVFRALPAESAALLVPLAQLTPFLTALGFFVLRRGNGFATVFALRWGRSWPAIGIGLVAVVLIGVVQLGVGLATGFTRHGQDVITSAAMAVLVVFIMQCCFAIGEEFGWRGWLVTQLQGRPFHQIALISAVAWVVWHVPALPLIVGDGGWQPGAAYLLAIASWAPFLVFLRLWSGSVWPAVIVHGALNSIRVFLTQSIASGDGVNWAVEIAGFVVWLVAAIVGYRVVRRRDAGMATQPPEAPLTATSATG